MKLDASSTAESSKAPFERKTYSLRDKNQWPLSSVYRSATFTAQNDAYRCDRSFKHFMDVVSHHQLISQWDAFFKQIAPKSDALRKIVARFLAVEPDDLLPVVRYQTDYQSRTVAQALHLKQQYKQLILDDVFETRAYAALGYEYQRTYNSGMPLRTLMYEIALRETHEDLSDQKVQFVILYSGRGLPEEFSKEKQGQQIEKYAPAILIDLNRLSLADLKGANAHSYVLALAGKNADDRLFLAAYQKIVRSNLKHDEADKLKKAMLAAAVARPRVFDHLRRNIVDDQLEESMRLLFAGSEAEGAKKLLLKQVALNPQSPDGLLELVQSSPLKDIESLGVKIAIAASTARWDDVLIKKQQSPRR